MKNIHRTIGILAFTFLSLSHTFAQGEKPSREEMEQKMKVLKMAFITERVSLSEQEAKIFWPLYNDYEDEMQALRPNREKGMQGKPQIHEMTDQEIEQIILDRFNMESTQLQLREEYFEKFKKVLPMQKIMQFYKAEHDFKKEIIAKFKERKEGPPHK